ncbi:patatin-like phospholipase family protein [Natronospora cellulosivora (SeqCode)]
MIGLVLEGGGARGSYEIGAYKAIMESGIEISGVAGTSIGSINAAMIAQGDLEKAYQLWHNITPSSLFDVDDKRLHELKEFEINKDNISYMWKKIKKIFKNRGIELDKIRRLLLENINEELIRSSQIDFALVTINLSDMKPMELYIEDIPEGKLIEYIMASSYLPVFKMEKMDGKYFLDGGIYDNLPIKLLRDKGYSEVIAIRTHSIGRLRNIDNDDIKIIHIAPQEELGNILDFTQEKMRYNLKLGYYDTLKVLRNLKGSKYYIEVDKKEKDYINTLFKLEEKQIGEISSLLNIKNTGIGSRRLLFEHIIPKLVNILDIDKDANYDEIILSLLEMAAKNLNLERFSIYTYKDLLSKICEGYNKKTRQYHTEDIPSFIKNNDILSRTVKEKILYEILEVLFCDKT